MTDFIEKLSVLLSDRQEFRMDAKKIGDDLVLMVIPDRKGTGKVTHITIPKDDTKQGIDDQLFEAIRTKANTEPAKFQSETTEGSEDEEEEDDEKEENIPAGSEKGRAKAKAEKEAKKKAAAKKPAAKKPAAKKEKKVEVKEETTTQELAPAVEEEKGPSTEEQFKKLMADGDHLFNDRKYTEARDAFKQATELKPEDEKAKQKLANAEKWVKAIENLNKKD